ncbi:hypothetical protein E5F05_17335 [Deinococcus metallilatus]|uniref:Uncharacterized protein n=1 Tax=Deinococcus metallilatus TaxID=1211322 RepID=A0AAJ5JXK0_9DEIO|nr:hypothetical protein [Deinococcus metallilatus]MBB5296801.1 hypothetical protein [Deinococcus metallilatus]QBY09542.1 hypothetical protein E5F05_17335 [Deinococcus metallilatus]RXJ09146.1 hypothetical protein ERJ73_16170 [Deinococcus metallilatus]TLK22810.1 hypothetical protein FCS05_17315 [Deinococcus metallilatus]GMA13833.1 hypothetical protein GCM10025871_01640 [Deinococcus metallilatus]
MNLRNLMRPPRPPETPEQEPGGLRAAARRAAEAVWQAPRVQDARAGLRERAQAWSGAARTRADLHLEQLLERRYGEQPPEAVTALLAQRRREREARAEQFRARQALLARAEGPEQRRVLTRVAQATPWAGGQEAEVRYTALLDQLAPSGQADAEMAVHRAIWTLAERQVLAVSPHGVITACPLPDPAPPRVLPERAGGP